MVNNITPELAEELRQLRRRHRKATERAAAAILEDGMSSEAYQLADVEAGQAWARIRQIMQTAPHWVN